VSENTASNNPGTMLLVNNIEVIYDHVILVLKGVSLEVPEQGIVALLGANGAGKTTTLKAISNLLRAERGDITKGSIEFRGERIDKLTPAELVQQANRRLHTPRWRCRNPARSRTGVQLFSTSEKPQPSAGRLHFRW